VTGLIHHLQIWTAEERFSGFLWSFAEHTKALEQRYTTLAHKALRRFRMAEEMTDAPGDKKGGELLDALKSEFKEQVEVLQPTCAISSAVRCCTAGSAIARVWPSSPPSDSATRGTSRTHV
jgi:hypothetical protein